MKTLSIGGLLASVLFAQQAVATYDWGNCNPYPNPDNCPNQCTPDQQGGYDWKDLPKGSFNDYKGMNFKGFTCQDSFKSGKRGLEVRTNFNSKCIQGKATQDDDCPSFSHNEGFSIKHMQVSTDKDSDLEFHYHMPDGSTCKQVSRCSSSGTTVQNNQCGGAKSVQVKGDCNFGIHSIGFDCTSHTTATPPATSTTVSNCGYGSTMSSGTCVPQTTPVTTTKSAGCGYGSAQSSGICVPSTSATSSTVKDSTTPPATSTVPPTTSMPATTSKCGKDSTSSNGICVPVTTPATTIPVTTPVMTTSMTTTQIATTTSVPVVTTTQNTTPVSSTTSVPVVTTSPPVVTISTSFSSATTWSDWQSWTVSTTKSSSPSSTPEVPCPPVLPKCLMTWLHKVEDCKSNSDAKCFCPSQDYIASVQECVQAWGESNDEVAAALSYLVGICADHVPQNPQICTGIPSTITLVPTPKPTSGNTVSCPVTTVTYTYTLTTGTATIVTQSVVSVPQVVFNTAPPASATANNVSPTENVALVPAQSSSVSTATQTGPMATFTGAAAPRSVSYGVVAGAIGLLALVM